MQNFFFVKNMNIYSMFYLISFNFKEPEPAIFGGSGSWFFFNRLRLQGVKNNRLLPVPAPAPQPCFIANQVCLY